MVAVRRNPAKCHNVGLGDVTIQAYTGRHTQTQETHMSKHLADHRAPSNGGRMKHFLRIARSRTDAFWRGVWQRPVGRADGNRRLMEYVRIERGRDA